MRIKSQEPRIKKNTDKMQNLFKRSKMGRFEVLFSCKLAGISFLILIPGSCILTLDSRDYEI